MLDLDAKIKAAMKAKNPVALNAYRSLKTKVSLKLNEAARPQGKALTEEEFTAVVKREVRERQESNEFLKPGDPAFEENAGIMRLLEELLPKTLAGEDLDVLIRKVIAETGAQSAKDMGKVMAGLKKSGTALDMGFASARTKAILGG